MSGGPSSMPMLSSSMAPAPLSAPPPPTPAPLQTHLPSSLSLGLVPPPPPLATRPTPPTPTPEHHNHHAAGQASSQIDRAPPPIGRVKLVDIAPYEGAPGGAYSRAVEALSGSLMRHNAVTIELGGEDLVVVKCALESARMYFKARALCAGSSSGSAKSSRGVYTYRAGRAVEDGDLSPACMSDAFRTMGKAARAALCAIARHLRLRSDVFSHLLDDNPLPANEVSSSVMVAACSHAASPNVKVPFFGGGKSSGNEVEKGLLTLIASDSPGIQVCDPNGCWYMAESCSGSGDLLLLTGRALSHATAGLRPAASYRFTADCMGTMTGGRISLTFRLMPQSNGILDCSPVAAAGHVIPQSYQAISVSQFMDDLSAEDDILCDYPDNVYETQNDLKEPTLRSALSDPLSGAFLEDAVVVSCGHSFGGQMLKKVIDMARCTICNAEIETATLIPNFALQAAARAVKMEDDRRHFQNSALRKRRKEVGDQMDALRRLGKENGEISAEGDSGRQPKGVQYPFSVGEKVLIKGNRRTPDKFVRREAVITSQCLNGWYLLKILDSGESVRLQYRSLQRFSSSQIGDRSQLQSLLPCSTLVDGSVVGTVV